MGAWLWYDGATEWSWQRWPRAGKYVRSRLLLRGVAGENARTRWLIRCVRIGTLVGARTWFWAAQRPLAASRKHLRCLETRGIANERRRRAREEDRRGAPGCRSRE